MARSERSASVWRRPRAPARLGGPTRPGPSARPGERAEQRRPNRFAGKRGRQGPSHLRCAPAPRFPVLLGPPLSQNAGQRHTVPRQRRARANTLHGTRRGRPHLSPANGGHGTGAFAFLAHVANGPPSLGLLLTLSRCCERARPLAAHAALCPGWIVPTRLRPQSAVAATRTLPDATLVPAKTKHLLGVRTPGPTATITPTGDSAGGGGWVHTARKRSAGSPFGSLLSENALSQGVITCRGGKKRFPSPGEVCEVRAECKPEPHCGPLDISKIVTNKSRYLCVPRW